MSEFNARLLHVGFVVDGVAPGQVYLPELQNSLPIIIPPITHIHIS
jgi:hypothetical protein